jgi:hypothetical protein
MGLLSFFLSAAATFGKLMGWLSSQDRQDRERIATYFDQIAACMQEVAERVEVGDPPRDTCRRLAVYADQLFYILTYHESVVAGVDSSAEETRRRLVQEIRFAQMTWGGPIQIYKLSSENLKGLEQERKIELVEKIKAATEGSFEPFSPKAAMDSLTKNLGEEFTGRTDLHEAVQRIWDASGDFKALADSLRAR